MKKNFDPKVFRNKKTIYVKVPHSTGICTIWDWDNVSERYRQRESGNRYYAYKTAEIGAAHRQVSDCFESFEAARKWRQSASSSEELSERHLFTDILKQFFREKQAEVKPTTLETYRNHSKHLSYFDRYYVDQIDSRIVADWLNYLKSPDYLSTQHATRITYRNELWLLGLVFNFYREEHDPRYVNPITKKHRRAMIVDQEKYLAKKADRRRRFIPRDDFERFLTELNNWADREPHEAVFYFLALFQLSVGARIGEACALSWDDVSLDHGVVRISKTVQWKRRVGSETRISPSTKTGTDRTLPLGNRLANALREWRCRTSRVQGLVFSADGLSPLSYREIQYRYNKAFQRAKVAFSSTHILRHSFATDFILHTKNPLALQGMLGHTSLKQTEHYGKVSESIITDGLKVYETSFVSAK